MVIDVQEGHSRQATESTFCPGLGTSGTSSPWLHSKAPQPHSQDPSETVPYPFPDYIPTLELVATGSSIDDFNPEPTPPNDSLVERPSNGFVNPVAPITPVSPAEFLTIVNSIREAIEQGINPVMIPKGSSGSYFCRNVRGEVVGVFKPKDEEPYGENNIPAVRNCIQTLTNDRPFESKMYKMDTQESVPLLLWKRLFDSESRLHE